MWSRAEGEQLSLTSQDKDMGSPGHGAWQQQGGAPARSLTQPQTQALQGAGASGPN